MSDGNAGSNDTGKMFYGLKTDGNKNALILNQYRNHVEELSLKHLSDLSRLRMQLEEKVRNRRRECFYRDPGPTSQGSFLLVSFSLSALVFCYISVALICPLPNCIS